MILELIDKLFSIKSHFLQSKILYSFFHDILEVLKIDSSIPFIALGNKHISHLIFP